MKYFVLCLSALLMLSGCASGLKISDPTLQPGQYHVTSIDISAGQSFDKNHIEVRGGYAPDVDFYNKQADLTAFKPVLEAALLKQLQEKGTGRKVKLGIKVDIIHLDNPEHERVLGKNVVSSNIFLVDPATNEVLGESTVQNENTIYGVLIKKLGWQANTGLQGLAERHAISISQELYPAK